MEGTFLYGVTDVSVTSLTDTTFRAQGILYTPFSYFESEEPAIESTVQSVVVFTYLLTQDFTLEMGKRGWYEITSISRSEVEPLEKLAVPTYPRGGQTVLSQ